MKALVKKYYQEFVDEINFPTIIYIYETGKVISYNKQALELIGKPIVNVSRLRAANPGLKVEEHLLENQSRIFYNQRFCAENEMIIEIDFEINSVFLQDRHLEIIFFDYSFKQVFCHGYRKLLPRAVWLDKKYHIMGSNETFRNEQGYFENEQMPDRIGGFLEEQTTNHMIVECQNLLGSKKPVFNILQLVQPVRTKSYFCKMNCIPVYNKNDTVVGLLTVYMLVFNREEYEQFFSTSLRENNILNQMICNTNMIIVSWRKDIAYHLQYVSSNVSNLGYNSEECYSGKVKLEEVMSGESYAGFMANILEIENGPKNHFNQRVQVRKADGSLCWVTIYVGINKRNNKSFFYECFVQELMCEPSYRVQERNNMFYMALPSAKEEMKKTMDQRMNDFCTYYQPIFSLEEGKVVALEAILRLKGGKSGVRDPKEVLTPAEYIALGVSLGEFLIQSAISAFVKLKRYSKGPILLFLELNTLQLMQPNYVKMIADTASLYGVDPQDIVLEMKESIAVEDQELMIEIIKEYKAAGFRVALTKFHGGAFSLMRLKGLDLDQLKFDKAVLEEYSRELLDPEMLKKEIEFIRSLGIDVLMDGVETKKQYGFLEDKDIQACQGNYLSVPLSYENIYKRMKEQ